MSAVIEDEGGGRFHSVQPLRDPESNWTVDVAKNLEEYLFKICSGEISREDGSHLSVNFAEAALLLQGSVQVYSRKVEYLYSLVLHALEFISQKRQQDQGEGASHESKESHPHGENNEEDDMFWVLDDVPVEAKNCLDTTGSKDAPLNRLLKPPANLVVLEGDCLENIGDGGELESYVLANSYVYQDFILLDPCDAASVDDFISEDKCGRGHSGAQRNKTLSAKSQKSLLSPTRCSGGTARKSSRRKSPEVNLHQTPLVAHDFEANEHDFGPDSHPHGGSACNLGFNSDGGYFQSMDSDDSEEDDDPWKPLNPHEPGNLKVKPYKKVKGSKGRGINYNKITLSDDFPLAKLDGPISSEFIGVWKTHCCAHERRQDDRSPPLFEKLRQSLVNGGHGTGGAFGKFEVDDEDNGFEGGASDFEQPDVDFPDNVHMDEDAPFPNHKHDGDTAHFDTIFSEHQDSNANQSLEDLCRSHLDALLASIGESERQTELATRVSTWKQKIERELEEQDARTPFDIHNYGERILDKLALNTDGRRNATPFSDVVRGQEKHDVARSFTALLQLVNNGSVEVDKGRADGESICYTANSPFHVKLLRHGKQGGVQLRSSKKRAKSPARRSAQGESNPPRAKSPPLGSPSSGFTAMKLRKVGRCTPESKRRRRSRRFLEPVDLHSAG